MHSKSHLTFWKLYFKIAQASSLAFLIYLSPTAARLSFITIESKWLFKEFKIE